jgi:hypothetical protein
MSDDLSKIFAAKADVRRELAALPIAEKLAMLDKMLAREMTIRASRNLPSPSPAVTPAKGAEHTKISG